MSFKENLLKKMKLDALAQKIIASLPVSGSYQKVDKDAVRKLLEDAGYEPQKERDMEIYLKGDGSAKTDIIVLDNELPTFHTTVADVAMRRSPTVKEMLNIRNSIKILNDKDIILRKKEETVNALHAESLATIDLSWTEADIDGIRYDGAASLKNGYGDGVIEALRLFTELLSMTHAPSPFKAEHCDVMGIKAETSDKIFSFGPAVIFNRMHNTLKMIEHVLNSGQKQDVERFHDLVSGKNAPDIEGEEVFDRLKAMVISEPKSA